MQKSLGMQTSIYLLFLASRRRAKGTELPMRLPARLLQSRVQYCSLDRVRAFVILYPL